MLGVITLSVIILNVIILSVIILNVEAQLNGQTKRRDSKQYIYRNNHILVHIPFKFWSVHRRFNYELVLHGRC
jgi:hypothetical protein